MSKSKARARRGPLLASGAHNSCAEGGCECDRGAVESIFVAVTSPPQDKS